MVVDLNRRIVVPPLTVDEQALLDGLVLQWRAKRPRNNLRSAMYDMTNSERSLMGSQVPFVIRRRKFVLGWSAIAVDKLNRRCNLNGFYDAAGNDLDSLGLPELVKSNRLLLELSRAGLSSLKHSVAFLITTQGDRSLGEPEVIMSARDATTATGMWEVRRRAFTSVLSITDMDDDGEPTEMTMYLDGLNVMMLKENGSWSVDRRDHKFGLPVDPLVYKADVGRPMGRSRISRSVMSIHLQALAAMIRADVNGEAYSLSRYVLLGATEEAFKNADGSPKAAWQAAWDAVWAVGDDVDAPQGLGRADVKRFSGESPEPQLAHLRMLAQMFSGETGIPVGELGIFADSNPTSADALTVGKDDLFAEAEQAMDGWSPDISSAMTRALTMLNGDVPDNLDIREDWRNPRYVSRAAEADAMAKTVDKFPWLAETEVGLELAGLTPDQIRRALAERQRANGQRVLDRLIPSRGDS